MHLKKFFLVLTIIIVPKFSLMSETPHFIDFKLILNESTAGKKAQDFLQSKLNNGIKNLKEKEKKIQEEEKKIIQQKKVISTDEYKKKIAELRKKISSLQKERNTLLQSVSKLRTKARNQLLDKLNPIMKNYMKEKNIRMVIDKKDVLLADDKLDITKDIISLLNKELKSLNLN